MARTDAPRFNIVDRCIAFFNPQAGTERAKAREYLHQFENRPEERRGSSGGMARNNGSENWSKNRDRIKDMWDARDLAQYDWIGGTLARVVLYVVGELECKANTGIPELNAIYDEYFHDWCGDDEDEDGMHRCDLTGRHRLIKLIQIALLGMFVDGDHGLVATLDPNPDLAEEERDIKLQTVEADRIGNPIEPNQQEDYIGGFQIDPDTGRVLFAKIYKRKRTGQYTDPVEVPPSNFFHLWDPPRGDQYRGVTILRPVLPIQRDIKEWMESEAIAGKTQSQWAALVGSKDPYAKSGVAQFEGTTPEGTPSQAAVYGKILRMAQGETFSLVPPGNRPSGSFLAGLQFYIRKIAVSLDLPYGVVWDLLTLGGVTARVEVKQFERRTIYWQKLLVDRILRRLRKMVLARGVALDRIPAHPMMNRCKWHFGTAIITDVGYEAQNDLAMVQGGILPVTDVAAKYNSDPLDTGRANAAVIQGLQGIAQQFNIPIELLVGTMFPNATSLLAAMNSQPPPPPKPGSLEAVGEKGAAEIVGMLSDVTQGKLDPEAARQALVTIYKVTPAIAESIVPKAPKREAGQAVDDTPTEEQ